MGGASSDIAEMALREIEATVRALGKAEKLTLTHLHNRPAWVIMVSTIPKGVTFMDLTYRIEEIICSRT